MSPYHFFECLAFSPLRFSPSSYLSYFCYLRAKTFCIIPTFVVTDISEVAKTKFVGVREFKEDVVRYLNEGSEIVVMKRKRPIPRLTPVENKSPEIILLEIGRIQSEAEVSKREALKALDQDRKKIYS